MKFKTKYGFYGLLLCSGVLFLVASCAKKGSPTGGPKDEDPPELSNAKPELFATNFDRDEIELTFNEYVVLKDLRKQFIVSPPLEPTQYEIRPQGSASRSITIKFKDTLLPNTTYSLNFGTSIQDNTEGNPFEYFKYVMSTGDHIDSLSLEGEVQDALNKDPDTFISVMLYQVDSTYTDSTIYKEKPTYMTNTLDSTTTFQLTNLRAGKYLLVALKDVADNYRFDQNIDKIGFEEEFVDIPTDTSYVLNLFKEINNYSASRPSMVSGNRILFGFAGDPGGMEVEVLSETPEEYRHKIVRDRETDTLNYWFTPFETDSLVFKVSKQAVLDTFTIKMRKLPPDSLKLKPNHSRELPLSEFFALESNTPLMKKDDAKIQVLDKDSTMVEFSTKLDFEKNQLDVNFDTFPNQKYQVQLLPEALTDFYGMVNDTLYYILNTKSLADYGSIRVSLVNVKQYPIIIQVTTEKGVAVQEIISQSARAEYAFDHLDPSQYYIRVIYDANKNGVWDTGNFLLKQQPEEVHYLPELLELRPNWDRVERLILSD